MKIKEIFLTIQGEGANWGMPAVFVRVGECQLRCNFCDTDFLNGLTEMTTAQVIGNIMKEAGDCRNIVFTGGEPSLYQDELVKVMQTLKREDRRWFFAVETNGVQEFSQAFDGALDWVCVSPKVYDVKITSANEVKVVYTKGYRRWLDHFKATINADHYFISPEAMPNNPYTEGKPEGQYPFNSNINEVIEYVKGHPGWKLNLQNHKVIGIR